MGLLTDPFAADFMRRALVGAMLAGAVAGLVGTWVIMRSLTFMGDAVSHGVLPGVALAVLLGTDVTLGAAVAGGLLVIAVALVSRRGQIGHDAAIGLVFVGMLSLGVIIMSKTPTFSGSLTEALFGNVLGLEGSDIATQVAALAFTIVATCVMYRPFVALTFSEKKAAALGLRPALADGVMLALVGLAVVASFRAVGTLLTFGLLVGPPSTALSLFRRIPVVLVGSVAVAVLCAWLGLVISFHADTAPGATVAFTAVVTFLLTLAAKEVVGALRSHRERRRLANVGTRTGRPHAGEASKGDGKS
ncbi:MAG: ABC transporter permease [Acidimicrobiales bacterium]|nr:MAG: ABC transporter permease [Acidimicrobiales bacterium]